MKTFKDYGVLELDTQKLRQINGGFGLLPLAIGAGFLAGYLYEKYIY